MDWGVELWDQFENVDKHLQHNIDFGEKYAKFVKERCSIEMEYATKMRKLVKSFQPKKREEDRSMFSTHKAFQSQLSELNDIAGQHETVAEEMMSKVSKSAQAYYNEIKVEKKKLYQDGRHHQSTLDQHERTLDQIKKKFEKEWKECERSESYFQKLDADTNVTKADVEKAKHMWMSRKDTVESCKTDYGAYLQQFNTEQTDHYQTVMPKIFACYRDCDEKGIIKFKDLMVEYAKIEQNVKPIIQKCLDGMARAANAIDAKLDAALVVERLKSGFVPPNDKEFEDFTSPNHGKTNHEDGSDSQRNSLVIGKQPNRKGLSWLFGQKKPAAVNYIRKQFSAESSPFTRSSSVTSDERKFEPEDSSNTPSQNEPKSETVQKSRTLSLTKKKQDYVNVDVDSDETLTRENRSSSYDVLREKNNSLSKQNGRQRSGSGDIRSSVSKNKKKLKTMFRMSTKPPEFAPKIEVSGPISVDMSGSAISTEGFIAAGVDTKPKSNFENLYDEVAGGDAEGVAESADFSHLPPEQRRKKLQKQIEEIRKELTKEDDGRKAILKMQDVYRSNPALGDAGSLEGQIKMATQKIDKLQADLNQHEAWYGEASATMKGSPSRPMKVASNEPQKPQPQAQPIKQPMKTESDIKPSLQRDQSFGDDFDEETEPIGTCVALYDFEATSDGALSMTAGQEFSVLEADNGDGWTRAMTNDLDGYVPTSYIEVKFFT